MSTPAETKTDYLQPGTEVGPYKVLTQLGRGGLAAVYKVERAGQYYALKIPTLTLTQSSAKQTQIVQRMEREIVFSKSLRHPNILRAISFEWWPDPHSGWPYVVTEFIDGKPLYEWARQTTPSLRRILSAWQKICGALQAMHRLEIFHRDLKSENILVRENDEPVVLDFNTARASSSYTLTKDNVLVGTLNHLSPEYCRWFLAGASGQGEKFIYRPTADLHAVGYIFYSVLTGQCAFRTPETEPLKLLKEIASVVPPRPTLINSAIPTCIEEILVRLLDKDPEKRPQTADELKTALDRALATADASWDAPFSVPVPLAPSLARTRGVEAIETVSDKPTARGAAPNSPGADEVQLCVELTDSFVKPAEQAPAPPPVPSAANNSSASPKKPGSVQSQREPLLVSPERFAPAAQSPVELKQSLELPEFLARKQHSPRNLAILTAGIAVTLVSLVLGLTWLGTRQNKGRSLLAKVEQAEMVSKTSTPPNTQRENASEDELPNSNLDALAPALTSSSAMTPSGSKPKRTLRRGNVDESNINRMLAEHFGRPTIPDSVDATRKEHPTWLVQAVPVQRIAGAKSASSEKRRLGIAMGAHVPVQLATNLDSRTIGSGPVEAKLVRPYVVRGTLILPPQTMVYGRAQASGGRFTIRFTQLRLPNDSTATLSGLAWDPKEKKPGLAGRRGVSSGTSDSGGNAFDTMKDVATDLGGQLLGSSATRATNNLERSVRAEGSARDNLHSGEVLTLEAGMDFEVFIEESV